MVSRTLLLLASEKYLLGGRALARRHRYEGKSRGGAPVVDFDDVSKASSFVTPVKLRALQALLADPRLEIAFQPIWDLENDRMLGVEALARPWPGYGLEGPDEMFAIAEKIGRAHDLDAICRSAALARADEIPDDLLLFLNVNPQSLAHDTLRDNRLVDVVRAAGLEPERVVLEITERSDARLDQVIADAARLRSLGFRLALDDVGAGNAGLEMLRELPVDFVKIDRSIITAAVDDTQAQALLMAIVAFASCVDAFVIAEGIETEAVLDFVRNAAELELMRDPPIPGGQGYLLGRPSVDVSQLATPVAALASPDVPRKALPDFSSRCVRSSPGASILAMSDESTAARIELRSVKVELDECWDLLRQRGVLLDAAPIPTHATARETAR